MQFTEQHREDLNAYLKDRYIPSGMGMKPPDFIGFYGCAEAHRMFDHSKDMDWSWEGVMRAMILTQIKLNQKGLLLAG